MTPQQREVVELDGEIFDNGEAVTLVRNTLGPAGTQIAVSVVVNAIVRGYQARELISGSGIVEGDSQVIISPSQINAAQWPGGYVVGPSTQGDQRVPRKGDKMVIAGKTRAVEGCAPIYMAGELVRMTVHVKG